MRTKNHLRYVYAILAVPLAVLLRFALTPLTGPGIPYITLFPVTVVVALLAGLGPSVVTGLLGSIVIDYLFVEPLYATAFDVAHLTRTSVVVLTSAFVGYVGDILKTSRARAEKQALELRDSQMDLNRAQAVAHTGSWRLDVRQNKLAWSDEAYNIFGVPAGTELTYESFLSCIHPDDKERVDTKWKAALSGEKYDIEHRIIVDGQIKWVRERAYLEFDNKGVLLGGFGTTQDITERKKAEEALRQAHDELERRVKERTADLDETVTELQKQVEHRIKAEETAKAERQQFYNVLDTLPAYVCLLTSDYYMPFANKVFREWFGYEHDKKCYEFLFNRKEPCENCDTYTVLKTRKPHRWEWTGPNGRNYDIFDFPFTDTDGSQLILEMGMDITERKAAEKALQTSEERYHSLAVATTQIVWTTDAEGQVVGDMPSWRAFTGQTIKEIQGWGWINSLHPDDRERTAKIWSQAVTTRGLYDTEYRIRRHDGQYRYVSVRGVPVKEPDGSIREWVGTCTDITERKQAQEALRSSALYMRGLLEASLDPLVTISPDGKITDVNKATEAATGLSRESLINTDFSDYFTEPENARQVYKNVLSEGQVKDYQLTIRHITGRTTDVLYNATVYKNEMGVVQGIFAAARDVTEHNRADARANITNALLELFAQKNSRKDYLDSVVTAIHDWSDCECVGIRLTNDDGFIPFESCVGYSEKFLSLENELCLKTDACACIRAISQTPEPQDAPLLTSKGSFRSNNSLEFVNSLSEKVRKRYRGNCMRFGFASLAVIPIHYRDRILGAIHLADKKENKMPAETVDFLENMAMLIGEAVHRFDIETEMRESEQRYRQLVEVSPDGIGLERDDKIVFINTAGAKLLGYDRPEELIGKPILDFVHPDYRNRTHRQLEYLRRKQKPLPLREERFIRVDGTTLDVEVAATPLVYQNKPAAQIVFRDITDRKLAQEKILADQKQLRQLTAELVLAEERERHAIATAMHDSIGPILAFTKREIGTLRKTAPSKIAESLENIGVNISDVVTQTRTLTFDLSPPTLYTLGFEIAIGELTERFCKEHKMEHSFNNTDAPKPLADHVKVLLYRSVRELLINIAKHAKAELVKVSISRDNGDIKVVVEDDGKGLDVSAASERAIRPKGLGLFSVRERLTHIGGKFEIESKRGKGTRATLTAPLKLG